MGKKNFSAPALVVLLVLLSGCTQPSGGNQGNGNGDEAERVGAGDKIAVEYRGTLEDGSQFDASEGRAPLEFVAGAGQTIKGFDNAVIGMALNEEKTVTLQPSEAYGEVDGSRVVEIPKSQITDFENIKVGMSITNTQGVNGVVEEIKDDSMIINFNHGLAGKTLTFWIKVVKIEKA